MKWLLKTICVIGIIIVSFKLIQELIDFLYENYGKKYITTEE